MNMKEHILSAMREQFAQWDNFLSSLNAEQITQARYDLGWSIQDVVAHLWAWQQISVARIVGAAGDRAPDFPAWVAEFQDDWEENADQTNAWVFQAWHAHPWIEVYENWRQGYRKLIASSEMIRERDLLDNNRYPWLRGFSPAFILLASYDHHQEHLEKIQASLQNGKVRVS